jgi:hypothetical protein
MKVLNGQSILDIAIQACGSATAAFALAVANGLSVTDDLIPGQDLVVPAVVNSDVVTYYVNNGIVPVTGVNDIQSW